jgi:hypothetical protein
MPSFLQVISDAITQGGFVMIPFLILTAFWAVTIFSEVIQRPFLANPAIHLLFPLGFLILGMIRLSLGFHLFFDSMRISGAMDGYQLSQDGLVFSRALLVLVSAAAISSVSTLCVLLWTSRGSKSRYLQLIESKEHNKAEMATPNQPSD